MAPAFEPRRFGPYLLVAEIGRDAMGRVYRALRSSGDRGFARLRIFDSPEISEDAVLDAIEQNGEIHAFLKNPTIARGVEMNAVDGTPFLAWSESSGRTLDALLARSRDTRQPIPFEHALLLVEKIATALDHAYNTMIDGERALHGLVWPGFVAISDDGEVRLGGFGLASAFFSSLGKPRFAKEVGPYLAPEVRGGRAVERNSDVFSAGAILFELLTGRLPAATDPAGALRGSAAPRLAPELLEVLRMSLAPSDARYQSAGELRRELGKLLFSGPYAPSTFNFAYFLNSLFAAEMEAENAARAAEALLDAGSAGVSESDAESSVRSDDAGEETSGAAPPRRTPLVLGSAALLGAALAGSALLLLRRPVPTAAAARPAPTRIAVRATATPAPALQAAAASVEAQAEFKDEVSKRVAEELKKIQDEMTRVRAAARPAPEHAAKTAAAASEPSPAVPPPAAKSSAALAEPTAAPRPIPTAEPVRIAAAERPVAPTAATEDPPKVVRIVKPIYPPLALKARIGGTVVLRVFVSQTGDPLEIRVVQAAPAGLSEAAMAAVRRWKFEPARRGGEPIEAWTTIPIPFQP